MKDKARCFGQDIMRGENEKFNMGHWGGARMKTLDDTSKKILKGGRLKSNTSSSDKAMQYAGGYEDSAPGTSGTSIFDPVLCELIYRWFSPPGGLVLDPFAGGSVRGIVAAKLGRKYIGVDLSARQIEENRRQWETISHEAVTNRKENDEAKHNVVQQIVGMPSDQCPAPVWHIGDSREIDKICPDVQADLLFSCPPYADLEVYSDDKRDLSTMPYPLFLKEYQEIIKKSLSVLKENRYACFVVGEVRDKKGIYYQFIPDTVKAFVACGLKYYNEMILVTAAGSLPIRAGRQFETGRKIGKTHQNVLVFVKGDPKKATADIGPVQFGEIGGGDEP